MDALNVAQRLNGGRFLDDLSGALTEVSERSVVTGTKGTVTVTFAIEPLKGEPAVTVAGTIKEALPVPEARGALFYAIGDGTLEPNDPRQAVMDFRVVPPVDGETRTVDSKTSIRSEAE